MTRIDIPAELLAERDRARATAVRLEQELGALRSWLEAQKRDAAASLIAQHGGPKDAGEEYAYGEVIRWLDDEVTP